jgi:DNA-binding HxlR family transcriptional regulator
MLQSSGRAGDYAMRRTNLGRALCPVARSLDEIGDWWTLLIVRDAFNGACRFGEFQRGLGLAKNILTTRLRKMVADGILEIRPATDGGAHNEYHLTKKGLGLRVILVALRQWGEDNLYDDKEPMTVLVDKVDSKPIGRLRLTAQDGRVIDPLDLKIKKGFASRKKQGQSVMQRRTRF